MKIDNEYTFSGSQAKVWELLQDPEVLAKAMPGTERLERVNDTRYEGSIRVGVGPVSGIFSLQIELMDMNPTESYAMDISAKGTTGFVNGKAHIKLMDQGGQSTKMKYGAELQIGGKLAIVGQRLLDTVGKTMIRQGLESLNRELQDRLSADG